MIQEAKDSGGFYCIDYGSVDMNLYSSWVYSDSYTALDIIAAPCGFTFDELKEPVREDRVWDQQETLDYLGACSLVVLYNQGIFKQDEFGENRIQKNSILHKVLFNPNNPNWIGASINRNSLSDEVDFLQYGQN